MKFVLYDQQWAKTAEDFEVYRFWRGEVPEKKWQEPAIEGLRYDITIIWPKMLGKEYAKTKGHRHQIRTSEVIKVLEGEAFYLFQKGYEEKVEDVAQVEKKEKTEDIVEETPEEKPASKQGGAK